MADQWGFTPDLGERRVLHPGPLRWLRALGWMVLLFLVIAFPSYGFTAGVAQVVPGEWGQVLGAVVGAIVCIGCYVLLTWGGEDRMPSEVALRPALVQTVIGLGIGLAMFSAVMGIMAAFGLYDIRFTGFGSPLVAIANSIQSGTIEEVLSRAVVARLLWRAFGPWVAFALSAALFGALHLGNPNSSPFAALCIAVEAGVMLAAFYALTGRVWVSIGVHAAWNFTQGYIFGAAVSGTDFGPAMMRSVAQNGFADWMTGGGFGPEASAPGLLVGTAVGVGVLWLAWKRGRFSKVTPAGPDATFA